jgi:hypothetical protein
MRKYTKILSVVALTASFGLASTTSATAACGQMDLGRDPSTYVTIFWSSGSNYTRIEPRGGTQTARAVIARYTQSGLRYYYGASVNNNTVTRKQSYVSATNGTNAGNYYQWSTETLHASLHNDYNYCLPGV